MKSITVLFTFAILICLSLSLLAATSPPLPTGGSCKDNDTAAVVLPLKTGADQPDVYLPLLRGQQVGLMANQTSVVGDTLAHLVDVLMGNAIDLRFAFAPEHGFRGNVERGETVHNETDTKTGLPLYTLYGGNEKQDSLVQSIDVMVFDLQDVGARFYTYITSLHRVMELCARHGKKLVVLDRPNPCGDQVDGPVRSREEFKSTVSYHSIAMVHGLTVGELARMILGEGWLQQAGSCDLTIVPVLHYHHSMHYELPVIPSPSLPNYLSVRLYASLCLFEGTDVSVGRGTDWPFQVIGYPNPACGSFVFVPQERSGMSKHVEGKGVVNYGVDLRGLIAEKQVFTLKYVLDFYHKMSDKSRFFTRPDFFDKLAGTDALRKQIIAGWSEQQIRASWKNELDDYKAMRKKYLLYP